MKPAYLRNILFPALIFIFFPLKVFSAGLDVEFSPVKINETVRPGESLVKTFKVFNASYTEGTFYTDIQDFKVSSELGSPTFFEGIANPDARYSLRSWLEVEEEFKKSITVPARSFGSFEVTIDVPENAEAGGHYAAVFLQTAPPASEGNTSVSSVGRIASLLLINVPGEVDESLVVEDFSTNKEIYFEGNPRVLFSTHLKNEGTVHAIPTGAFFISGGSYFRPRSVLYNINQLAVMPGAPPRKITESFVMEKEGLIPPFGKFEVILLANYGSAGQDVEKTLTFWVLPAKFFLVVFIALVGGVFVLWRVLLSFRRPKSR
jgi:hypothetical protein